MYSKLYITASTENSLKCPECCQNLMNSGPLITICLSLYSKIFVMPSLNCLNAKRVGLSACVI